ncbi:hypothetical protein OK351_03000 [Glutamicibacter sp. MNS18]|uniref:hypothetical protein n=1 Tax=Glutamicibacter sp. MNS18 TaxID=2989817 RepID=UPI002235F76A|nr:hypothetical protein [Glutamicibacter sp. MNS18]MCW4464479.1 hypothetical protein [Glutamicibacter sp. MNS18]
MTNRVKQAAGTPPHRLRTFSAGIGAATVVTGATQAAVPGTMLRLVGAQDSPGTRHLFATVGMFMVVVGGALAHAASARRGPRIVLFWAMLQKLGAVAAVGLGVHRGVFARRALLVAAFDLVSAGILAAHLASRLLERPTGKAPGA